MLGQDVTINVRFQNSSDHSIDCVIPVSKAWTWSGLLTEIGNSLEVPPELISHLVLLNKTGSEISLNISDFAKFKRILNMYSNPTDMKFNVLFSKSDDDKKKSLRLRFRLSSNVRRNLDITITEGINWKDITDLIATEFSVPNKIHHLVLTNREGENVSKPIADVELFWPVASTFNIEKDGVFVVYDSAEENVITFKDPNDPRPSPRPSPSRNVYGSSTIASAVVPIVPLNVEECVFPSSPDRSMTLAPVKATKLPTPKGAPPTIDAPTTGVKQVPKISRPASPPSMEIVDAGLMFPKFDSDAEVDEVEDNECSEVVDVLPPLPPAEIISAESVEMISSTHSSPAIVDKVIEPITKQAPISVASPPRAFKEPLPPAEPVMVLFSLYDDVDSTVRVVLSDHDSWEGLIEPVATAFGINSECINYFQLFDKDNDEISPFLRNVDKFWRIYAKKYSLVDRKKFVVQIDNKKRLQSNSFSVLVKLSSQCEHLASANPVRNVMFPRDSDWASLSHAVSTEFGLPSVLVHHFIVLDVDGDEMSAHLGTVDMFWKAANTFARDNGDAISVHLDDVAIKETARQLEKLAFLETAVRFTVSLDCDASNKGECLVADNAPWSDIVRSIAGTLNLTNGSVLQKIVLVDAGGNPMSPDVISDKKFWKIFNVKFKHTPNSYFLCTFQEASRQKAFFDLCATGTQTSSLLDLIRKGVDINAINTEVTVTGVPPSHASRGVHLAAQGGHVATLRVLCSLPFLDIRTPDAKGRTPMYLACQSGSGDCIQLLVDKGVSFKGKDEQGQTALHMIGMHGFEVVKKPEDRLRSIFQDRLDVQLVNAFDDNCVTPLMCACKKGDYVVAKVLVDFGAMINLRDKDGMSPLLYCIGSGSFKLLTYILQQKPNITARNNNGDDCLLLAAAINNHRVAEHLISLQMDTQTRNSLGQSLYQVASSAGFATLAQWFAGQGSGKTALTSKAQRHLFQTDQSLEKRLRMDEIKYAEEYLGVPIRAYTDHSHSIPIGLPDTIIKPSSSKPLVGIGVTGGDGEGSPIAENLKKSVHFMIQNMVLKSDPVEQGGGVTVKTDLFNACKAGDTDRVREICRVFGDTVDICSITSTGGDSLLHIATYVGNLELCKFLHRQGLAVVVKDKKGYTPFHAACEEGLYDLVSWMTAVGASCCIIDDKLMSPMHYACQKKRIDIIKLLSRMQDCQLSVRNREGKLATQYIVAWPSAETEAEAVLLDLLQAPVADLTKAATLLLPDAALPGLVGVVQCIIDLDCCSINVRAPEDGQTAMHRACRGGKLEVVKLLVRKKADLNIRDNKEMTPLLHACSSGNLDLVKYISSSGSQDILSAIDCNGDNALHVSTRNHDTDMVRWLLSRGLDCNRPNYKKCAAVDLPEASDWSELKQVYREHQAVQVAPKPKDRKHVLYVDRDAVGIYDICSSGVQDDLYALFESGGNLDAEMPDGSGYTALHIACEQGNYSVVAILTKNGCHFNRESRDGETPLYIACRSGSLNVAKLLVELGVDCNEPVADSTLLHAAASNKHFEIVSWLVEAGVDIAAVNAAGFSAIHIASRDNDLETVQLLFELGANADVCGINAPLHVACFLGHLDIAQWLVSSGASPNSLHEGRNAFLIACSGGQLEIARWLATIGTDVKCVNAEDGLTALHRACMGENIELCEWLMVTYPELIRMRAADEKSALSFAVLACNDELVDLCERYLLENTASEAVDLGTVEQISLDEIRDDMTDLLSIAISEDDLSVAPFILQRLMLHTDVKYVFTDGCTVLHFAATIGDLDVLTYLLANNAVVDAVSDEGRTPLHYAAISGQIECAEKLINAGADCLAKDVLDRDAMQFAQHFKRKKFAKWLRRFPTYIDAITPKTASSFIFACLPIGNVAPGQLDDSSSDDEASGDDLEEISGHTSDGDGIVELEEEGVDGSRS